MDYEIKDKSIVIFGFGAQGHAQALNLQDGGFKVTICLPKSSLSIAAAKSLNFRVITNPVDAAKMAEIAVFLVPDTVQSSLYNEIRGHLPLNSAITFAHGLNIHYDTIKPRADLDVILVAPLAHGEMVRKMFLGKTYIPSLIAVHQDATGKAWQIAKLYATAMGANKCSLIESTFKEETETDLFAEQALICGGISELITAAFNTLVEEGYSQDIAYYCCLKEAQIMTEMFARQGILKTFEKISDVARYGALSRGPRIVDDHVKEKMREVLREIKDGRFIKELGEEMKEGRKATTKELMRRIAKHRLELIHQKINKGELI